LEIRYFECLDSTQKYLVNEVREGRITKNCAVVTKKQNAGIGSRNNSWIAKDGDILFSFAIKKDNLPDDLPISSASIYFAFLMKEVLNSFGQECWLKWPNDIYIKDKKCGGVITNFLKYYYVVGIGVNLVKRDDNFAYCNIKNNVNNVLNSYFMLLKKARTWQEIFSKYKIEYGKRKSFLITINNNKVPIERAILCSDGALLVDNERIYSLR